MKLKQIALARAGSQFGKVLKSNALGQADVICVPGHDSKYYRVILRRTPGIYRATCFKTTGVGEIDCQGNTSGICYHALAAVMVAAKEKGYKIYVRNAYHNAVKAACTYRGRLGRLISTQSQSLPLWLIIVKEK